MSAALLSVQCQFAAVILLAVHCSALLWLPCSHDFCWVLGIQGVLWGPCAQDMLKRMLATSPFPCLPG